MEDVNRLVQEGVPFRDAYVQVGMAIESGEYTPSKEVAHTHEGSIGNLCNQEIASYRDEVLSEFTFDKVQEAYDSLLNRKN